MGSPTSTKKETVSNTNLMTFPQAIEQIIKGKTVTKKEWGNVGIFIAMKDGKLKIKLADGSLRDLIVSDGDLLGEDWVVIDGGIE